MNNTRRTFMMTIAAGSAALTTAAHAQAMADEKAPQSVALGYVANATKTDTKKYPKYAAGQVCTNCALYQGKATDAAQGLGAPGIEAGRHVVVANAANHERAVAGESAIQDSARFLVLAQERIDLINQQGRVP